ncbi:MAG: arginine repressor [Myxococcaceae bacterium]
MKATSTVHDLHAEGNLMLARRSAIARILRSQPVATQDELRRLLAAKGFRTTQGTLSRDLARLGARRTSRPSGGGFYELSKAAMAVSRESGVGRWVSEIAHNATLVVIFTEVGAAPAVARVIDESRPKTILGTIAGDDTVFVAPSPRYTPAQAAASLRTLFRLGGRR